MKFLPFPALGRDVSQLVLGSMVFSMDDLGLTFDLLNEYLDLGGNLVDTAHIYGGGNSERALGRWIAATGRRDEIFILTKGAHHNVDRRRVTAEDITCDLRDSLARLGTDYVDLYVLHRDDPLQPVGGIIEALNSHIAAGRILAIGASNWSIPRIEAANAYAADRGLKGFCLSSNHLSLAAPKEPVWLGCVDVRDAASRAWHAKTQFPLMPWSSQARGFFSGLFSPEVTDNDLMVRVYYSQANWARLDRAREIGLRRGFQPIEVALAWVLHQPFPCFPLIGPRTVEELHSCVRALDLSITPAEAAWLDTGETPATP